MSDVIERIYQADGADIQKILQAVLHRYAQLFPEWEVSTFSVEKNADKNKQLDEIIALLQKMKTDL